MEGDKNQYILLDTELSKYGIVRQYSVGDIVLVKVKGDNHHWPGKVTNVNLCEGNFNKVAKKDDQYEPVKSEKKRNSESSKTKSTKTTQIVYRIKYYEFHMITDVTQEMIRPFTYQAELELINLKNKKVDRALHKAKLEMKEPQRVKFELSKNLNNKKIKSQKINQSTQLLNSSPAKTHTPEKATQKLKKQKNHDKKILKKNDLLSQTINPIVQEGNQQTNPFQNDKISTMGNAQQDDNATNVKKQFNDKGNSEQQDTQNQNIIDTLKEEYFLENIFFKNRYQILGVLHDLLDDFTTTIIWLQKDRSNKLSKSENKRYNILIKIMKSDIFLNQDLSKSRSVQKMLNIVKISEMKNLKGFRRKDSQLSIIFSILEEIVNKLKQIQSQYLSLGQKEDGRHSLKKKMHEVNLQEKKSKKSISGDKMSQSMIEKGNHLCIDYNNSMNLSILGQDKK